METSCPNFIAAPRSCFRVSTVEKMFFLDRSDLLKSAAADFNKSLLSKKNIFSTVETLKQLRGAAMKFGQLVSIDSQIIFTPEISKIVGQLRSSGYSMPPNQIKKILDKNWGKGPYPNFYLGFF